MITSLLLLGGTWALMRTIDDRWMVELGDCLGLFQPWCFSDSVKYCLSLNYSDNTGRKKKGKLFQKTLIELEKIFNLVMVVIFLLWPSYS